MELTWRAQLVFMNGKNIRHATTISTTKEVTSCHEDERSCVSRHTMGT